jgi:phenol 2-monooxygenase
LKLCYVVPPHPKVDAQVWRKFGAWTAGTAVDYQSSALVAKTTSRSDLATGLTVGMVRTSSRTQRGELRLPPQRFPSTQVVTLSSGRPRQLLDLLTSDGRWRLVVFTGDVRESETKASLDRLVAYLDSPKSIISRYTPAGADRDAAIEVLTVVGSPRSELDYESFADALRPLRGPHRYRSGSKAAGAKTGLESLRRSPQGVCRRRGAPSWPWQGVRAVWRL